MSLHYQDDWLTVYHGDCKAVMAQMEPESVHCVVTSPPYWGLRDYGEPGQLGLEASPDAYVASMVDVFREVRRVLRADGTVWLNLGDCYHSGDRGGYQPSRVKAEDSLQRSNLAGDFHGAPNRMPQIGLKDKDLVGIPWRVAFALQADGWYLRSDIIWSKPNPMPESVTDRPTKSHEYLFLLSKSPTYFFDQDAVREPQDPQNLLRYKAPFFTGAKESNGAGRPDGASNTAGMKEPPEGGRNIRSVWTIATAPYPGAHFATFPPKLVEPCIKAGTSEKGVCPECGAPWEREVERTTATPGQRVGYIAATGVRNDGDRAGHFTDQTSTTTGWRPGCRCEHDGGGWVPVGAMVLDPFAGSGTTGMVAQSLSRRAVLIDLSLDYLGQLMDRNADIPLGLGA